jgi:hypothetical protein
MRPQLVANPAHDPEFVRTVRDVAAQERSWRVFEAKLRTRYPEATVRHSELSGDAGERWYVYRDGHYVGDSVRTVGSADED